MRQTGSIHERLSRRVHLRRGGSSPAGSTVADLAEAESRAAGAYTYDI